MNSGQLVQGVSCTHKTYVSFTFDIQEASRGCQGICSKTVGDRTFAIAGARLWKSLPPDVIACDTVPRFRHELKTFLFRQSYPSIVF